MTDLTDAELDKWIEWTKDAKTYGDHVESGAAEELERIFAEVRRWRDQNVTVMDALGQSIETNAESWIWWIRREQEQRRSRSVGSPEGAHGPEGAKVE